MEYESEYDRIEAMKMAETSRVNNRLLQVLKKVKGRDWVNGLQSMMKSEGVHGPIAITRNRPNPILREDEDGPLKEVWVRQRSSGNPAGYGYYGTIWVKIDSRRYLELQFAM